MTRDNFSIDGKKIGGNNPIYFIADIAANHDGDLDRAKDLIYLAADAGAQAAKFQHFQAETIVSDYGFKALGAKQSHQSSWKKTVYEVYKDASVSLDWTETLVETCKKAGITFFSTPYSIEVIEHLDKYVPAYKIGSGDITWHEIIKAVAAKNKPYMIACGASTMNEVIEAVKIGTTLNQNLCLMQCNTNYTASLENLKYINLRVLNTFKNLFPGVILGLSDHTPGDTTVLGAVALGASVVEKHFTDDQSRNGPDHKFSMNPTSWRAMVERTSEVHAALGVDIKKIEENEIETAILQRRSLRTKYKLDPGHVIAPEDLIALRPCPPDAINPYQIDQIIGRKLRENKEMGDYIKAIDLA